METGFSKTLFWDTDASTLDLQKSKFYVIERIVTRGNYSDWKKMLLLYNEQEIKTNVVKIKDLDPKNIKLLCFLFRHP